MESELKPSINAKISICLDEMEARALSAITTYGTDSFLRVFYKHLGKAYLQKYEVGVYSLFEGVHKFIDPQLNIVTEARRILEEKTK